MSAQMEQSTVYGRGITEKKISNDADLKTFLGSQLFADLWGFVLNCNTAVKNLGNSAVSDKKGPGFIEQIVEVLEELSKYVDDTPPIEQVARFGNKAFRTWHQKLSENAADLLRKCLPPGTENLAEEFATYLETAFGNETRIDYGSGHEATFIVLMYCFAKVGAFTEDDLDLIVLRVFRKYLDVTRKLQSTYKLEPAGSHGVWGLDDYSFANFLWGASQLHDNRQITPTAVVRDDRLLEQYKDEFLYVDAIRIIKEFKRGPFYEHSPMLRDISEVREGWPKINSGLIKMYRAEVWGKRPVVQHLLFGSVFKW
eukprot:Plantae.Rhodophyta-Purpureofilum_apyrenoidigerum.ctg7588.p1 GENE.Plantae.Rhodophyta-Purpureofilum_apyrenoidigerum.ctg7588~~Plantae.Rhodophyta-Purpureofilum_apyrenoidigerum.ctg7588.p1  ORF type:complete len:312 (-),score=62.56 Plantae.Rhodophyta-Purpureofilum_apyrenoidigerum.ctg7588:88-1023(-)